MNSLRFIALLFTISPPAPRPSGIAKGPYLQNPTTSAITVCWVSDTETTGAVTYAPEGSSSARKTVKETKPAQYHKVRISGLRPYSQYAYSVECDGQSAGPFIFKTAAPPSQPFRFIAYGDNRSQPSVHAAVLKKMAAFKPDFVIQSGDLVANGYSETQWDEFWQVVRDLVREVPYYPSLGNHEGGGAPYFRFFDVGREYSFDYGNAHFVALDSNRPPSEHAAQEEWLRKDLAAHQDAAWRIVFFHHTPHTCVVMEDRRRAAERLNARLEPIFKQGKVQLVVSGHDHNYQHHLKDAIHYIVSGGGGAPLYDVRPDTPFVVKAKKAHHDCEITVDGNQMMVRAVEPDGTVIDSFVLYAR